MARMKMILCFAVLLVCGSALSTSVFNNEDTEQDANKAWAGITSENSDSIPILSLQYPNIDFPAFTNPGLEKDTLLTIENTGNVNLTYTVAKFETLGPAGWLGFSGFTSPIVPGFSNSVTGTVKLNVGGISNPAGKAVLKGGLVFTSNAPSSPDTLPILFTVADTIVPPSLDTLFVRKAGIAKLALTVSSNGNFGNLDIGRVNMDYANYGDCDTTAATYLYDGSAVIGWVQGSDTIMNWAIFGNGWLDDSTALRPYTGLPDTAKWHPRFRDCPNYEYYRSARFVTHDTTLAMEKTWWAPKLGATATDDSLFIIQGLKVWNISGAPLTGVTVGDVIDWNVPSDSNAINSSGVNTSPQYIYQRGVDYNDSAGNESCQPDSLRFGGIRFLARYTKNGASPVLADTLAYSAYTARNDSFVVPNGGFIAGELYRNFASPGFATVADTADLHMGMCFRHNFTINPTDTFMFYTVLATVRTGTKTNLQNRLVNGKKWFKARDIAHGPRDSCYGGCDCATPGDVNNNGSLNVADINYLVAFMFNNGPAPPFFTQADVNNSGTLNIADLIYLVQYFFNNGPHPLCC